MERKQSKKTLSRIAEMFTLAALSVYSGLVVYLVVCLALNLNDWLVVVLVILGILMGLMIGMMCLVSDRYSETERRERRIHMKGGGK